MPSVQCRIKIRHIRDKWIPGSMSQTSNTSTSCFSYRMVIFQYAFLVGKMFNLCEYSNQNNKIAASRIVSSQWESLLSNWYFNYFLFYKESFELHNCISLLTIKKIKDCMVKCIIFNTNCYIHLITCHVLNWGSQDKREEEQYLFYDTTYFHHNVIRTEMQKWNVYMFNFYNSGLKKKIIKNC